MRRRLLRFLPEDAAGGGAAVACAQCRVDGVTRRGAGQDASLLTASVLSVPAAVNRAL